MIGRFFLQDCLPAMKDFPDKYFNLAIKVISNMGLNYVGFEIDEDHYQKAKKRLESSIAIKFIESDYNINVIHVMKGEGDHQ